jgi:hypothetical protein
MVKARETFPERATRMTAREQSRIVTGSENEQRNSNETNQGVVVGLAEVPFVFPGPFISWTAEPWDTTSDRGIDNSI